jgi:hypothetical protein
MRGGKIDYEKEMDSEFFILNITVDRGVFAQRGEIIPPSLVGFFLKETLYYKRS